MNDHPPRWNLWARNRFWTSQNPAKAQIAIITALAIGMIVIMGLVTIVVIVGLLR